MTDSEKPPSSDRTEQVPLSAREMREIYEILTALEPQAAFGLAQADLSWEQLAPLERATIDMEQALERDDLEAWADADGRYHDALMSLHGNARLTDIVNTLSEQVKALRRIAKSDREDVRRGAVLALGLVGDRRDVDFLVGVMKSKEESWLGRYTRGAAAMAIGLIGDGESVGKVQNLLGSSDKTTRALAVATLGWLADKDDVPALRSMVARNNFRTEFDTLQVVLGHL